MSVWDDPELQVGGDYVKFDEIGDSVSGTVNVVRSHRWDDGTTSPQLLLTKDDGDEATVTAGQIRLKLALAEQRPEPGDHVSIKLVDVEKRAGGKTLKKFDVVVTRGGAGPTLTRYAEGGLASAIAKSVQEPAAQTPQPEQPIADPAAAAAALAALSPEQRQALGIG